MADEPRDMNRDPITGKPGSHPVGTGVGSAGGATVGALIGALGGPIGMLVGGTIGAVAGGAAGHAAGEAVDPTGETEYWRENHRTRDYFDRNLDYEKEYAPAYRYGWESRSRYRDRRWDDALENDLRSGWDTAKGSSSLAWEKAKRPIRDAWDRTDRTFRAHERNDRFWKQNYQSRDYFDNSLDYDRDYKPAYRYGAYARTRYADRNWDDRLENDLGRGWDRVKGESRLGWDRAKLATRDAWHSVERAIPGDADHDGR